MIGESARAREPDEGDWGFGYFLGANGLTAAAAGAWFEVSPIVGVILALAAAVLWVLAVRQFARFRAGRKA